MITPDKIFSPEQIKAADHYTIQHEPITSINLMERAANKCFERLMQLFPHKPHFIIFCGLGNNGGDGLAIARLLYLASFSVRVYIIQHSDKYSDEFKVNEHRLIELDNNIIQNIYTGSDFPIIDNKNIIIDAILGTGITKPVQGLLGECISKINQSKAFVVSIDLPSGMFADKHSGTDCTIVKANLTLSFQFCKVSFLFPENGEYIGEWEVLDIGLSKEFIEQEPTVNYYISKKIIQSFIKQRTKFSHKGTYGHALLIAGSYGKIGAAVLAAKACLRSGAGLLTVYTPTCGYEILQVAIPEAMVNVDSGNKIIQDNPAIEKYTAIGIGPGIGTDALTQKVIYYLLTNTTKPLVLDADALNTISLNKDWLHMIPPNSILTPHPKEFERLTQKANNDFDRHSIQLNFSIHYKVYVVLKGAHTCITTPDGISYFNSTGNPGMAKAGSGDVLTGSITSLLAQGYHSLQACLLGVYLHGLSGDIAKEKMGEISMLATDIIDHLPNSFLELCL